MVQRDKDPAKESVAPVFLRVSRGARTRV